MSNIFNLISQLMGTTTGAMAGGSNWQDNMTSNMNIRKEHFSYFGIVGANPFRRFEAFRESNNNNPPPKNNNSNNLPLPLLLPPGLEGGLEASFNLLLKRNARGLDPNVAVL